MFQIQGADNSAWSTGYGSELGLFCWGFWKSHGAYMQRGGDKYLESDNKEASDKPELWPTGIY